MSAYALPGLFPPIVENSCNGRNSNSNAFCEAPTTATYFASLASSSSSRAPSSQSSTSSGCPVNPLSMSHYKNDNTTSSSGFSFSTTVLHSSSSSAYANLPPLKSLDDESEDRDGDSSSTSGSSSSMLGIAIKEAKIDPVRFVQYLTGSASSSSSSKSPSSHNRTLRRRGTKERGNGGSPKGSPVNLRRPVVFDFATVAGGAYPLLAQHKASHINNTSHKHTTNNSKNSSSNCNPHNEAIEFELSITFQGRKYTAKRTMQCMIKLRDDLIREMNTRRQWLLSRQMPPSHTTYTEATMASEATTTESMEAASNLAPPPFIEIPEIPTLSLSADDPHHRHSPPGCHHTTTTGAVGGGAAAAAGTTASHRVAVGGGMGFVGRGFTMLHAMVTSYVPVMDTWLKAVMAVVPQDSECLLDFLWEPITSSSSSCCGDNQHHNSSVESSLGSLLDHKNSGSSNSRRNISMGSIQELDIEEEEEEA